MNMCGHGSFFASPICLCATLDHIIYNINASARPIGSLESILRQLHYCIHVEVCADAI